MNVSRRGMMMGSAGMGGLLTALFARQSQANAQNHSATNQAEFMSGDRTAIINVVNGIAIFADLRDWHRCRQSFTDEVEFDYTSMMGGQPTVIAADQQMQQWATFFDRTFKNTQHIIGSHVVTLNGDQAACVSNFQAHHTYLNPQQGVWVLNGIYHHDLVRASNEWKVNRMKMTIAWETGNRPA